VSDVRRPAWDDDRLGAAFSRYSATAPLEPDLATDTMTRLRSAGGRSSRVGRSALMVWGGLAAAAVIVIALAAWPRPSAPPVGQPVAVADLPVIEVLELVERMTDPQPDEFIVHGWFAVAPAEADCEVVKDPHPLVPDCEEWYRFLMAEPETLGAGGGAAIEPVGDHVIPILRIDSHIEIESASDAVEVLAVGHLADHRTTTCPTADQAECSRRFVIDRLLPPDAVIEAIPDPWAAAGPPVDASGAVVDAVADAVGPLSVVSIGTMAAADLTSIEPIAAGDEPAGDGLLWVIRALVGGATEPRTFVVVDGTAAAAPRISEITATAVLDVRSPDPSAPPADAPTSVLGLPVIDVTTAIEHRDAGDDPIELAVRGWYPRTLDRTCPISAPKPLLVASCDNERQLLLASPEVLIDRTGSAPRERGPVDPHVGLELSGIEWSWVPDRPTDEPTEVILVGHFDDDRAAYCDDDQEQTCRDRFVVDRVAFVDGREVRDGMTPPPGAESSPALVLADVEAVRNDDVILGLSFADGPAIRRLEPAALGDPDVGPRDGYWIVRSLADERVTRYLVIDASAAVFRIDGTEVTLVAGTPPGPDVPLLPNDEDAVVRPIGDVRGGWEATFGTNTELVRKVTIVDRTATVFDVRLPTDEEARLLPIDGPAMQAAPLSPTSTVVGWGGSLCELESGLEITDATTPMLTLSGRSDALCRMALATTRLVLEWSVDRDDVALTDARRSDAFPTAVAGLIVQPVGEAIKIRDADDDREIAVKGWIRPAAVRDCGESADPPLLDPGCRSGIVSGDLVGADGVETIPFVSPMPLDIPIVHDAPVVLVGHFDDRRAAACPVDRRAACQDAFVVDAIWSDGRLSAGVWELATDPSVAGPSATRDAVARAIRKIGPGPGAQVLSVGQIRGPDVIDVEPAAIGTELADTNWVWHVTVLFGSEIWTYLLPDGDLAEFVASGTVRGYQIFDGGLQAFTAIDGPPTVSE
jgi:hypothetical protein